MNISTESSASDADDSFVSLGVIAGIDSYSLFHPAFLPFLSLGTGARKGVGGMSRIFWLYR